MLGKALKGIWSWKLKKICFKKILKTQKIKIMPSYGEKQMPAGVELKGGKPILGSRTMTSRNKNVEPALTIDQVPYKGNAALNANK